jgi:hypothetical protein
MRSLSWTQHKSWIPIRLMGCVHTHWKIHIIEGWGNPSGIRNTVKKTRAINWKLGKIGQIISQTSTFGPKCDRIWAQWALNILWKNMLKTTWWCKHYEMEFWNWTIYCLMSYSNKRKHVRTKGDKKSHVTSRCC